MQFEILIIILHGQVVIANHLRTACGVVQAQILDQFTSWTSRIDTAPDVADGQIPLDVDAGGLGAGHAGRVPVLADGQDSVLGVDFVLSGDHTFAGIICWKIRIISDLIEYSWVLASAKIAEIAQNCKIITWIVFQKFKHRPCVGSRHNGRYNHRGKNCQEFHDACGLQIQF